MRRLTTIGCLLLVGARAFAADDVPGLLTLDEAVRIARAHQPQLRQAHAQTEAAAGHSDQIRAPLLPQLNANASFLRYETGQTSVVAPGTMTTGTMTVTTPSWLFSSGLTANQLIFDFGQTTSRWHSAQALEESQRQTEQATTLQVILNVRSAYMGARANKALVGVAQETLANQNRHLAQVQAFVEVGTRPEIDLAQARSDQATAEAQLINAQSNYAISRAQLRQAMGLGRTADFEVSDQMIEALSGEDSAADALIDQALAARPEFRALEQQLRAQELSIRAAKGSFGPALGVTAGGTYRQATWDTDSWVVSGGLTLSWPVIEGGLQRGRLREASANLDNLRAGVDLLRQQITVEVEQARLAVTSSKAAIVSADKALVNARQRLRLAEARYQTGVGNAIELGDAQLAVTNAGVLKLQAEFQLGIARAQMRKALGQT